MTVDPFPCLLQPPRCSAIPVAAPQKRSHDARPLRKNALPQGRFLKTGTGGVLLDRVVLHCHAWTCRASPPFHNPRLQSWKDRKTPLLSGATKNYFPPKAAGAACAFMSKTWGACKSCLGPPTWVCTAQLPCGGCHDTAAFHLIPADSTEVDHGIARSQHRENEERNARMIQSRGF